MLGSVIGAAFFAQGAGAVIGEGVVDKVLVPAALSPALAFTAAGASVVLAYRVVGRLRPGPVAGGWRMINTMGNRIHRMDTAQGFAAQGGGAAVILAAWHYGFPLSTTHAIAGGAIGAGAAKRLSAVRWGVARNILAAWILHLCRRLG